MQVIFLTLFYSGKSPIAPGTIGSIVALFLGVSILFFLPPSTLFLLTVLISVVAVKSINAYEKQTKTHDDKSIVIDELAGVWFALALAPGVTLNAATITDFSASYHIWAQIAMSFLFFRLYDIAKPSIIGRIDREVNGGIGVMGDDIVAGFAAGISSALSWLIVEKIISLVSS